jgi:hypothetical protein
MNTVKIVTLSIALFFVCLNVQAQEPRPSWVTSTPVAPATANFVYTAGVGTGSNEAEAFDNAMRDAIRNSLLRGGLIEFSQETIDGEIEANRIRRTIRCRQVVPIENGQVRVFVLLQVPKRSTATPDDLSFDCHCEQFNRDLARWAKNVGRPQRQPRQRVRPETDNFFSKGHNSYISLGYVGIGYPFNVRPVSGFAGRHGGRVGFGYYANMGIDIGGLGYSTYGGGSKDIITGFHYSLGAKFFPYKNIFLSAGFGTLGLERMHVFNDDDGRFGTDGWRQGTGVSLMAGYNLLFGDLKNRRQGDVRFSLSISAGMSYDLFMAKWQPALNFTVGMNWYLSN